MIGLFCRRSLILERRNDLKVAGYLSPTRLRNYLPPTRLHDYSARARSYTLVSSRRSLPWPPLERVHSDCMKLKTHHWSWWCTVRLFCAAGFCAVYKTIIFTTEGVELTMYTIHAMAEIEFRIFSQNFGCCVETCVSWLVPTCRPSTYGGIETVLFENSSYRGFGEALYAGH